jgi:hypothetical protein
MIEGCRVKKRRKRHTDSLLGGSGGLLSGLNTSSKLLSDLHVQLDYQLRSRRKGRGGTYIGSSLLDIVNNRLLGDEGGM